MPSANSFICKKIPRRKSAGFSRELSFFSKHLPNLSFVRIRKGPAFGSGNGCLSLCVFQRPGQSLRPTVVFHMNAPEYALYRHTEHSPLKKISPPSSPGGACFFRSHLAAWALRFFQSRLSGSGSPLFLPRLCSPSSPLATAPKERSCHLGEHSFVYPPHALCGDQLCGHSISACALQVPSCHVVEMLTTEYTICALSARKRA